MAFPNEEMESPEESEETEQFLLKLRQLTASPPLTEEFHERLRERLKRNLHHPHFSSGAEDPDQEYEIQIPRTFSSKAAQAKAGKQSNWWKGAFSLGGAAAALVMLIGTFWLYELTYFKRSIIDTSSSIFHVTKRLQEIQRNEKELYEALADTINKMGVSLNSPQGDTSKALIQSLVPLIEEIDSGKPGYSQQLELKPKQPGSKNRAIVSISVDENSRKYCVDKDTLKTIEYIILESLVKFYSDDHLIEERNKTQ
jgi:hypothetical protein